MAENERNDMRVIIREQLKIIEFWLNSDEKLNDDQINEYSKDKYFPIIYYSGKKDFIDNTIGLLKNNLQLCT